MTTGSDPDPRTLRRQAEERLRARKVAPRSDAPGDVLRLIHELEVHQIELELQNEELRRTRDQLEASAARYSELYDFAPVAYATLDGLGTIVEINLVGAALLGEDRARVLGKRLASWVTPATRPAFQQLLAALQGNTRGSCEIAIVGSGGAPIDLHVNAVPDPRSPGDTWRCHASLTDITELKAAAQIRESDRRKSAFLAMLSHELRNPLAPIRTAIHLLDRVPPGSEQAARARAVITRQTAQLTRLVDDLLDLNRIERGKISLQLEPVDLRDVVRLACDDHRATIEEHELELRVVGAAGPVPVRADRTRLAQVIGNLLHNAAKFTPPGGTITVGVSQGSGRAVVRVADTGIGIAPDQLGHLFEPFAQGDQGLARTLGGLGLGLSLVKALAELHDGTVAAASGGLGQGAEFVVTLPLAAQPAVGARPERASAPRRTIVIIEDNLDAAETLQAVLELDGHKVEIATSAIAGIELTERVKPEFVLCDIGLPDLSGYEVAKTLRTLDGLRATRLVALSGYAQPEDRERSRAAGFDAHLAKPPDLDALNALLGGGR